MASSTWARKGGSPRYPRQWVVVTTVKQDDEVREFADAVNRSNNDVIRDAIAAGLPVLRRRAVRDGLLSEVAA
jgi:predicted transcriptional regulator